MEDSVVTISWIVSFVVVKVTVRRPERRAYDLPDRYKGRV
jgi:hypothetical protein